MGRTFPPIPNTLSSYAAGTVYSLTNAAAKVDFGTTDPGITITNQVPIYFLLEFVLIITQQLLLL